MAHLKYKIDESNGEGKIEKKFLKKSGFAGLFPGG